MTAPSFTLRRRTVPMFRLSSIVTTGVVQFAACVKGLTWLNAYSLLTL